MITPEIKNEIPSNFFDLEKQPNKSYRMRIEEEHIQGNVDDMDAIAQAVYKCLNTERFEWAIYSWNYGVELKDLFGMPVQYVFSILPTRITEALLQDDRITSVENFKLSHDNKGSVLCEFDVVTTEGTLTGMQKVVTIN